MRDRLLEQVPEPYPLHAYDTTVISLLSAFYPHRKPGYGAGIYATTGAVFMAGAKILDCIKYEKAARLQSSPASTD